MKSDLVDLDLYLHHETEKAILISETRDGKQIWLPKSRCEFVYKDRRKGIVTVTLPEALATDKELV